MLLLISCILIHVYLFLQLRELVGGSNVFVSKFALENVKDTCKRHILLARALLDLVFTDEALSKCSVRGKKANNKGSTSDVRPGLYQPGVDAVLGNEILPIFFKMRSRATVPSVALQFYQKVFFSYFSAYARRYARKNKWPVDDDRVVIASMRQKTIERKDRVVLNTKKIQ